VPAFWVELGADDPNCVDVPLNPTHSLTHLLTSVVIRVGMVSFTNWVKPVG